MLEIENLGQIISMANLSRNIIDSGEVKNMIGQKEFRGITSNSTIFEKVITGNAIYDQR